MTTSDEFTVKPDMVRFFTEYIQKTTGVFLESFPQYYVVNRLRKIMLTCGYKTLEELQKAVSNHPPAHLIQNIIDVFVNNETSFFREMQVFEYLKSSVLPEIIKKNENKKCFSMWCAAASTGQEPYSLMMLMYESFQILLSWRFRFLATDVSSVAISTARAATYREHEILRGLPVHFRDRYLSLNGKIWSIKNEIKKSIEFKALNLINDFSNIGKFDIILIRNMFIYLSESSRVDVLNRIKHCLNPEGYVIIGASEVLSERITFLKQPDVRFPVYRYTGD